MRGSWNFEELFYFPAGLAGWLCYYPLPPPLLTMQKRYLLAPVVALLLAAAPHVTQAQTTGSVGIGTTTPNASAALEIKSTSQGLLLPRLTLAQLRLVQALAEQLRALAE